MPLTNLEMRILHAGPCLGILLEGKDVCGKTREQEAAAGWFEEMQLKWSHLSPQTEAVKVLKHTILV